MAQRFVGMWQELRRCRRGLDPTGRLQPDRARRRRRRRAGGDAGGGHEVRGGRQDESEGIHHLDGLPSPFQSVSMPKKAPSPPFRA